MNHLELLAEKDVSVPAKNWLLQGQQLRREAARLDDPDGFARATPDGRKAAGRRDGGSDKLNKIAQDLRKNPLAGLRKKFLLDHFIVDEEEGKGPARARAVAFEQLAGATMDNGLPTVGDLPRGSATLVLRFQLTSPLLTKDDDPFYLFDNPVRRDHLFGVPYLSAAAIKGLSADAYQRAFTGETPWAELGGNDPTRTLAFRRNDPHALRLFGAADDGAEDSAGSWRGRLHFAPAWFRHVQYLIMNPGDPTKGIGTVPIQFEAIAPMDEKGKPSSGEIRLFYFNPLGTPDSDESTVRADLARWIASVATWWPALGLGAKRLAGYGAIVPLSAELRAHGWADWKDVSGSTQGPDAWMTLARRIAGEKI
jgi:hypothetical protein